MKAEQLLASRFVCSKCKSSGGRAKRIAATGTGLSKLFDIQHNHFVAVSCNHCGYTELFNPDIIERKSNVGTVIDILFGG
jgi:predicted nucleic-acid-binding Zn-ribbon protein